MLGKIYGYFKNIEYSDIVSVKLRRSRIKVCKNCVNFRKDFTYLFFFKKKEVSQCAKCKCSINDKTLFIEINVEEADINKLSVGQKANAAFDALDGTELEGEISFISMTSETSNNGIVTYSVRIVFEKGENDKVREGMTAYVEFITAGVGDVLVIPVDAVRNVGGKPSVELYDGSRVEVVTGFTDGDYVEVISGLLLGDKIIY
jgi:multidrug efflux pump subunit AcrA (membrane-fusion protein)